MAGRRIHFQQLVHCSASVSADEFRQAVALIINIYNFNKQQLRADDFQMPPHRQAVPLCVTLDRPPSTNQEKSTLTIYDIKRSHN